MFENLIKFLLRDIKVSRNELVIVMCNMDEDEDGYISLGELVAYIKGSHGKWRK